jgi:hypothetical protein
LKLEPFQGAFVLMSLRKQLLPLFVLTLAAQAALPAGMAVTVTIPRIDVSEYHRPYFAAWIEGPDQAVAANLAVWYEEKNEEGTKWLADLRQWWRRSGREQIFPIDGVTGATRPAGQHMLKFDSSQAPLSKLAPGNYTLAVEAAREVGGREVVKIPFTWPITAAAKQSAAGKTELGEISLALTP